MSGSGREKDVVWEHDEKKSRNKIWNGPTCKYSFENRVFQLVIICTPEFRCK
jgi:hypothetical protein